MEGRPFKLKRENKGRDILWRAGLFCFFVCNILAPGIVLAQEKYPAKPINFLIGFPAGGTTDVCARPLVTAASKILGQPIVVVNKPGGASAVAVATLKNEKPDGYTIGILGSGAVLSQHMRKVPYDTAKDYTPIMQYAIYLYGLVVRSDSPWNTFKEFIDYAKNNPGKIRYSTAGPGSPQHLVMERLALKEKIKWTHIPFQGGGPAVTALLGGHVEACLPDHGMEGPRGIRAIETPGRLRGETDDRLPQRPYAPGTGFWTLPPPASSPSRAPKEFLPRLWRPFTGLSRRPWRIRISSRSAGNWTSLPFIAAQRIWASTW